MKKFSTERRSYFAMLVLVFFIAIFMPFMVAHAQTPVPPVAPDLATVVQAAMVLFAALVGWPAALAAALSIAMSRGLSAQWASWIAFGLNALVFLGLAYLVVTGQTSFVSVFDSALGGVAKLLVDIAIILGIPTLQQIQTGRYTRSIAENSGHFKAAFQLYSGKK